MADQKLGNKPDPKADSMADIEKRLKALETPGSVKVQSSKAIGVAKVIEENKQNYKNYQKDAELIKQQAVASSPAQQLQQFNQTQPSKAKLAHQLTRVEEVASLEQEQTSLTTVTATTLSQPTPIQSESSKAQLTATTPIQSVSSKAQLTATTPIQTVSSKAQAATAAGTNSPGAVQIKKKLKPNDKQDKAALKETTVFNSIAENKHGMPLQSPSKAQQRYDQPRAGFEDKAEESKVKVASAQVKQSLKQKQTSPKQESPNAAVISNEPKTTMVGQKPDVKPEPEIQIQQVQTEDEQLKVGDEKLKKDSLEMPKLSLETKQLGVVQLTTQQSVSATSSRSFRNVPKDQNMGAKGNARAEQIDKRTRDYMQLFSKYQKVHKDHHLRGYDPNASSEGFLFTISGVTSLSLRDTSFGMPRTGANGEIVPQKIDIEASYFAEYHCTLHSNQVYPGYQGFYGRTCISDPIPLTASQTDPTKFNTSEEDFIYLHSSYKEITSTMIVEIVLVKEHNHEIQKASAGFAVCNIFDLSDRPIDAVVVLGTPRMHGSIDKDVYQRKRIGKSMLTFLFKAFEPFDELKNLVPLNCPVNVKDIIPGLNTELGRFPMPRLDVASPYMTEPLSLKQKRTIYLHNISLVSNPEFEKQFVSFLRHYYVSVEDGQLDEIVVPIKISQRSIQVGVSNAWRDLNQSEKIIVLEEPDKNGLCRASTPLALEDYIEDPLIALSFRVVFQATLPLVPKARIINQTIAWQVFMPQINKDGTVLTQHMELEGKIGNQSSLENDLIWGGTSLTSHKKPVIEALVSTDETGKSQPAIENQKVAKPQRSGHKQKKPTQSESILNALSKIDISAIENPPEVDVNNQMGDDHGLHGGVDTDQDMTGNNALDAHDDTMTEALDLELLKTLQGFAHDVLINTELKSTALVMITLQTIDEFVRSEVKRPRIIQKLEKLLKVLQPDAETTNNGEQTRQDFYEVKEWLKTYLIRNQMNQALSKRINEGSIEFSHRGNNVDSHGNNLEESHMAEAVMPKEYVDKTDLTHLLRSVLDYQFKQDQTKEEESSLPKADDKDKKVLQQNEVALTGDPLSNQANKEFTLQFLTKFALKGFKNQLQVDITDVGFPHKDKNILKQAGIVKEDTSKLIQDNLEADESERRDANIKLYKTLFRSFHLNFHLLALKKIQDHINNLPAQFTVRFKLYNFEWTSSSMLFLDPLTPQASPLVPIIQQSDKPSPQSCTFDFCIETDIDRFVDYIFSNGGEMLRIYFYTTQSELLFAQTEIDLSQILTCAKMQELFQVPIYSCQHMATPLEGEPLAFLQFAAGTQCEPHVDPYSLQSTGVLQQEFEDPVLKVLGKENIEVGNARTVMHTGEKPSMEEFVFSTESNQLRMFQQVRKKVRVDAMKYKHSLESEDPERTANNPFSKAFKLGNTHFLKEWLKESEFQRKSICQQAIKNRIYQGNSEQVTIRAYSGQPYYLNVLARNEENFDQTYKVEIFDQNLPLGAEQPDLKSMPLKVIKEEKEQEILENKGILRKNSAVKCADLNALTKLKDGKLLISLGPRKVCNLLLKYLSLDCSPKIYLVRLTKLVDKYDVGKSFQIKANFERDSVLLSNSSAQKPFTLAPDQTLHVSYDPSKPFSVSKSDGSKFSETTKIWPQGVIERKPDGNLGGCLKDKILKAKEPKEFQVFEYADPDRNELRRVTLLVIEPVYETPTSFKVPGIGTTEGFLDIRTPQEKDIFSIKCQHSLTNIDGLTLEVGSIIPNDELNQPGQPITFWKVPLKVTCAKGVEKASHRVFLSFIDATQIQVLNQKCFAKYMVTVDVKSDEKVTKSKKPIVAAVNKSSQPAAVNRAVVPEVVGEDAELISGEQKSSSRSDKPTQIVLDQPGAKTIIHQFKVPGRDTKKIRQVELSSSRPKLLQIMGPSTRSCKSGDVLDLKLAFYNRNAVKKQSAQSATQQATQQSKPIKIMVYISEEMPDDDDDSGQAGGFNELSTGEDDEPDYVSALCTFEVVYQS